MNYQDISDFWSAPYATLSACWCAATPAKAMSSCPNKGDRQIEGPCLKKAVQVVQLALQTKLCISHLPLVSFSTSPHTGHNLLQLGPEIRTR